MKKNNTFRSLSFIKNNLRDINSTQKELKAKELEFRKEWNKWGKLKQGQG